MKIKIENPGPKISNQDIDRIESLMSAKLPADYREFLQNSNGGQPWPDTIDIEGFPGSPTDVSIFFGIDREVETSNLNWVIKTYPDLVLQRLLPIAMDSGGNLFVLNLHSEKLGFIQYLDISNPVFSAFNLAGDFTIFLNKFREF